MAKYTTRNLFLGLPEAEAEAQNMLNLYQDYMGIETALSHGKFIVTGRKGSGKSAYAVWLNEEAKTSQEIWCKIVKHNDRLLEQVFRIPDAAGFDMVVLFEWIIIYHLIILITDSGEGKYGEYASKLYDFRKDNAKLMNEGMYDLKELINKGGIDLTSLRIPLLKIYGTSEKKLYKADFLSTIHYLKAVLIEALKQENLKHLKYYVIFDDLDVKFKLTSETDKVKLVDLIRTVRDYNTSHLLGTASRVVLLLRDDISAKLSGVECDTNKILESYEHHIDWYTHYDDGNHLRQFINRRIALALEKNRISVNLKDKDYWNWLVGSEIDYKSSFKYILDNTYYLPRDILTIFKEIGARSYSIPISRDKIDFLLEEYAKSKFYEIRNELVVVWNEQKIDTIFEMLGDMFDLICDRNDISYEDLSKLAEDYKLMENDLDILVEYSLIIPRDIHTNKLFIKYREKVPTRKKTRYFYGLHKVLMLYFNAMQ